MVRSLRLRVALSLSLVAMLMVLAQSIAMIFITEEQEDDLVNEMLHQQIQRLQGQLRKGAVPDLPFDETLRAWVVRTPAERERLPAELRTLAVGPNEFERDGRTYHVEVRREGDATLYLMYDATRHEQRVEEFASFLLLAVIAMGAVTAGVGYWISGMLVEQVADLGNRVARLDPAQSDAPLSEGYRDEEVVQLAQAFDHYHRRVAQLLAREQEFTATASHELRTPLTAIQTGCELLQQDPALGARSRERIASMERAASRMTQSIEALLYLARETSAADAEPVHLRSLAEEVLEAFRESPAKSAAVLLAASVPEDAVVEASPAALRLVLANLVKNALDHTRQGSVTVVWNDHCLSVTDTGAGIGDADLPRIFERFYRGGGTRGDGSGLGLAIVKHVADRYGWRVEVSTREGQGSEFRVHLADPSRNPHAEPTKAPAPRA